MHKSILLILGVIAFSTNSNAQKFSITSAANSKCRCMPGDFCWPTKAEWSAFNRTISGRLIATIPLASSCHVDGFEAYDAGKCARLQSTWANTDTHWKSSSSIMAPFPANRSCDPFAPKEAPCVTGTYIQYAVNAQSASDFQKTIAFVKQRNIRLVIRNTGHDYFGKSTGAGAVGIWTHNMKSTEIKNYRSDSYTGKALKMGAGVQAFEAFQAAAAKNLVVVGGTCQTVGLAGGYTQGGGTGLLSSRYGLGADQTLEFEVVTGTGKLLTATPCQNKDLYWALSGGGGGTYGVVLSMTVRAYPELKTAGVAMSFSNTGLTQTAFYNAVKTFIDLLPALSDAGSSSVWLMTNAYFSLSPTLAPGLTKNQLDGFFAPALAKYKATHVQYNYTSASFPTFHEAYAAMNPEAKVTEYQLGNRLISRSLVVSQSQALVDALKTINDNGGVVSGVSLQVPKRKGYPENAVNPAWRDTIFSATVGTAWNWTNWNMNIANQKLMTNTLMPQLEKLTPGGGAYLNEGNSQQPNYQQVFYGQNYHALQAIKDKYDPDQIFYAVTAVGSDRWKVDTSGRLCPA